MEMMLQELKTGFRLVKRLPEFLLQVFEIAHNCRVREHTAAILEVENDSEAMT